MTLFVQGLQEIPSSAVTAVYETLRRLAQEQWSGKTIHIDKVAILAKMDL